MSDPWAPPLEVETAPEGGLSLGVLIVGSLLWDNEDDKDGHRQKWRDDRLEPPKKKAAVDVPIRYGKFSSNRKCWTMVFSEELVRKKQLGAAIAIPFRNPVRNIDVVVNEAELLWAAEEKRRPSPKLRRISKNWGCVALWLNPNNPAPEWLRDGWKERLGQETEPGYPRWTLPNNEKSPVDGDGLLIFDWPKCEDGSDLLKFDALLATATEPKAKQGDFTGYPSADEIVKSKMTYFDNNHDNGIATFQDCDIIAARERLK